MTLYTLYFNWTKFHQNSRHQFGDHSSSNSLYSSAIVSSASICIQAKGDTIHTIDKSNLITEHKRGLKKLLSAPRYFLSKPGRNLSSSIFVIGRRGFFFLRHPVHSRARSYVIECNVPHEEYVNWRSDERRFWVNLEAPRATANLPRIPSGGLLRRWSRTRRLG